MHIGTKYEDKLICSYTYEVLKDIVSCSQNLTFEVDYFTGREKFCCQTVTGARGSVVGEALCYKPEGHRFESRMTWIFQFT
jgi:hypothetical protein